MAVTERKSMATQSNHPIAPSSPGPRRRAPAQRQRQRPRGGRTDSVFAAVSRSLPSVASWCAGVPARTRSAVAAPVWGHIYRGGTKTCAGRERPLRSPPRSHWGERGYPPRSWRRRRPQRGTGVHGHTVGPGVHPQADQDLRGARREHNIGHRTMWGTARQWPQPAAEPAARPLPGRCPPYYHFLHWPKCVNAYDAL
jgi:hypothetical protein